MRTIWIIPGMFGLNVGLTFGSTQSGNNTSLKSFAADIVAMTWTKVADIAARWEQRKALKELPSYMLKDIGLSQMDVAHECNKPFWR